MNFPKRHWIVAGYIYKQRYVYKSSTVCFSLRQLKGEVLKVFKGKFDLKK